MNQVLTVVRAKLRMARHEIAGVRNESRLKIAVISVSALLLLAGMFVFFFSGFRWIVAFGGTGGPEYNFGELLMTRLLGLLFLSLFMLLVFSNVLVSFATLYRSHEVKRLMLAPMRFDHIFQARFFECVAFSSWSIAFLGAPMFLAYGLSMRAHPVFYLALVAFFLPAIVIPACLGCITTMFLVRVFPRVRPAWMAFLGAVAVGLFFLYIRHLLRGQRISDDTILPVFLQTTARMQSPFLPSHWASQGILAASRFRIGQALYWWTTLASTALFLLLVSGWLARTLFYPGWSWLAGQDRQRFRPLNRGALNRLAAAMRLVPEPARCLSVKDVKLFWRDPTQWSQFVIFFGIMAIYIANLRNTSKFYEQEMWRSWIACLNVGAVTLILATLTSRFVFPLVSLEGRRMWIIGLAPLTFAQVVRQKFWMSVATSAAFTVGLAFLSAHMLRLEPVYFFMTVYTVTLANFGLAGLAVGLGALYPVFKEDNPARIVSGLGGTLNLLLSVGYIAFMVAALTLIMQWRALGLFTGGGAFRWALGGVMALDLALTLVCSVVPLRMGLKNLQDMEL
ncbi:MAG TPA: hypothetical protein PL005_05285 [Candidatus Hydrogenedentes bacterium]|nr:hypothetical protein [Candidatus Hydrogenedentota bacterium]